MHIAYWAVNLDWTGVCTDYQMRTIPGEQPDNQNNMFPMERQMEHVTSPGLLIIRQIRKLNEQTTKFTSQTLEAGHRLYLYLYLYMMLLYLYLYIMYL